jgi:hypothetical protein
MESFRSLELYLRSIKSNGTLDSMKTHDIILCLTDILVEKISRQDDIEIIEIILNGIGMAFSLFGPNAFKNPQLALEILLERVKREATRVFAIQALTKALPALNSSNSFPVVDDVISYLTQTNRTLVIASLEFLVVCELTLQQSALVLNVLSFNDSDLQILHCSLNLLHRLAELYSSSERSNEFFDIFNSISKKIYSLFNSSLIVSLENELFNIIVTLTGQNQQIYNSVFSILCETKQCPIRGRCLSHMIFQSKNLRNIEVMWETDGLTFLSALGHLGYLGIDACNPLNSHVDCSHYNLYLNKYLSKLSCLNEKDKLIAAESLGYLVSGNLPAMLNFILHDLDKNKCFDIGFVALRSILRKRNKERLGFLSIENINDIWNHLLPDMDVEFGQDKYITVISECIGLLILLDPNEHFDKIKSLLRSERPLFRIMAVSSYKYFFPSETFGESLKLSINEFFSLMRSDPDLSVRLFTVFAFNSFLYTTPYLLTSELLDWLYESIKINESLVKIVQIGPFKHKIDDGMEIRKAAVECMYTILNSEVFNQIEQRQFVLKIVELLNKEDINEILALVYLMIAKLAHFPNLIEEFERDIVKALKVFL